MLLASQRKWNLLEFEWTARGRAEEKIMNLRTPCLLSINDLSNSMHALLEAQQPFSVLLVSISGTLTVDDALELIGFGKFQWKISFISGMAWVRATRTNKRFGKPWNGQKVRFLTSGHDFFWEQVGDAMEMMILSILAPQLHCEWRLPSYQVALVTSVGCLPSIVGSSYQAPS